MRTGSTHVRLLATFLTIVAGLQTGCNRPEPKAAAPEATGPHQPAYKFVVVSHATAGPFFVPVRKGVEGAGKLLGVDASFTGPADFNVARQIEFIKAAIAAKVDGIGTTLPHPD